MALVFEPEGLIYDATERLIRIFAIDGPTPISVRRFQGGFDRPRG